MTVAVTWLLPIKNGMPFLPETLESIAAQTCKDFTLLAWDNGSTDSTVEELKRWIPDRVATNVAGNAEIVIPGQTGFLAESPSVPSIRRALEEMWKARGNLNARGQAAAKVVRGKVPPDPVEIFAEKLKSLVAGRV
jgi:hypothetical protein